jgi:hypothetical protein
MKFCFEDLQKAIAAKPETAPKDFKTTAQWAAEWGKPISTVDKILRRSVLAGVIAVKSYRIQLSQCVRAVPHYGPKR